jgi:drug/metabolite transporter (DMT)-like permease
MSRGIILCFLGAISFGLSACVSKIAARQQCNAPALIVSVFGWAAGLMLLRTLASGTSFSLPGKAMGVAVAFGMCAAIAILAFQVSIAVGKVTVAWLVMNLSAGVPALVSIWLYRESLTWLKGVAFVVAFVALACLFKGKRQEDRKEAAIAEGE